MKLDNMFIASLVGDIIRVSIGCKLCVCVYVLLVHNSRFYNATQYTSLFC